MVTECLFWGKCYIIDLKLFYGVFPPLNHIINDGVSADVHSGVFAALTSNKEVEMITIASVNTHYRAASAQTDYSFFSACCVSSSPDFIHVVVCVVQDWSLRRPCPSAWLVPAGAPEPEGVVLYPDHCPSTSSLPGPLPDTGSVWDPRARGESRRSPESRPQSLHGLQQRRIQSRPHTTVKPEKLQKNSVSPDIILAPPTAPLEGQVNFI